MHRISAIAIFLVCTLVSASASDLSLEKMGVTGEFFQKGLWNSGGPVPGANCLAISAQPAPAADDALRESIRAARAEGLRVLLVPNISDRDVSLLSPAEQDAWFADFFAVVLRLAALAREEEVEFFALGQGLRGASGPEFTERWARGVAKVRETYPGWLTYGAGADGEFSRVGFWNALDLVGIVYSLPMQAANPAPVTSQILELQAGLASLSQAAGKPVIFTELALQNATTEGEETSGPAEGEARFLVKEFFQQIFPQPWLQGIYVRLPEQESGGEPAGVVVRDFFESAGR